MPERLKCGRYAVVVPDALAREYRECLPLIRRALALRNSGAIERLREAQRHADMLNDKARWMEYAMRGGTPRDGEKSCPQITEAALYKIREKRDRLQAQRWYLDGLLKRWHDGLVQRFINVLGWKWDQRYHAAAAAFWLEKCKDAGLDTENLNLLESEPMVLAFSLHAWAADGLVVRGGYYKSAGSSRYQLPAPPEKVAA